MKIENVQTLFVVHAQSECSVIYQHLRTIATAPTVPAPERLCDIKRRFHSLAGSAGLIGRRRLSQLARRAEKQCEGRSLLQVIQMLEMVTEEVGKGSEVRFVRREIV